MIALITGITGQDGYYLSKLLLSKGYTVHGIVRRCSTNNTTRISSMVSSGKITLHYGDLGDTSCLLNVIITVNPDEIYNLAAMSDVAASFAVPEYTADVDGIGVLRLLEAVRISQKQVKVYQASTSELFGNSPAPQSETTPFDPRSPYAAAKLYAFHIVKNYRDAYGIYACNGILFNHESPYRGKEFVTAKVAEGVAKIKKGILSEISIGNLNSKRDWGHASEYVEAMWLMLQQVDPDDYVVATGTSTSVRDFVTMAFACIGMIINWQGTGIDETGVDQNGIVRVRVDPSLFRPTEVNLLLGDASKAKKILKWEHKIPLRDIVAELVSSNLSN